MTHGRTLLRDWIRRSRNNQKQLAADLEMSDAYLSQILKGIRRPKLEMLMAIEQRTGVPVSSWADTRRGKKGKRQNAAPIAQI